MLALSTYGAAKGTTACNIGVERFSARSGTSDKGMSNSLEMATDMASVRRRLQKKSDQLQPAGSPS
jgi:hypothetical protein